MTYELVQEIERKARDAGISINELCERADTARSTLTRWKMGKTNANIRTYQKLMSVLTPLLTPTRSNGHVGEGDG